MCPKTYHWPTAEQGFEAGILAPTEVDPETNICVLAVHPPAVPVAPVETGREAEGGQRGTREWMTSGARGFVLQRPFLLGWGSSEGLGPAPSLASVGRAYSLGRESPGVCTAR